MFVGVSYFPVAITAQVFLLTDPIKILESLGMSLCCITYSMKVFILRRALKDLLEIRDISKRFEDKAKRQKDEYAFILEFKSTSRSLMKVYYVAFTLMLIVGWLGIFTNGTNRLVIDIYLPYDFSQSKLIFGLTTLYEIIVMFLIAHGNAHLDTYPGLLTFLLSQHVQIFNLRVSKIGYDRKRSREENHQLLKEAAKDHREMLRFYKKMSEAISATSLVLFLTSSINIVSSVVNIVYYTDTTFNLIFRSQLMICYAMQTVLSCYYGSEFEVNIFKVTESLYSCNWYEQSKLFKKDLCVFLQFSLVQYDLKAGGLIPMSKDTFVRILKTAFSLFTILRKLLDL